MSKSKISNSAGTAGKTGLLIVLSAPSGCGKTTIVDRLLKRHPDWTRSISLTTRHPRAGEKNGVDYYFVSSDQLEAMAQNGELLESAVVFGSRYATPRKFVVDSVESGKRILLAIDVQGAKIVKQALPAKVPVLTIFILPPSVKVLRDRLEGRKTESPEEVQQRIETAQEEIKEASFYDCTVVNQNLDETIAQIEDLIEKNEKTRRP